jgi:hypothetical protein
VADNPIHVIRVSKDGVEPTDLVVRRGDGVAWVPTTTKVKVKVKFRDNKSPFSAVEFPDGNPSPGDPVYRTVRDDANSEDYRYGQPGSQLRSIRAFADPVIIVRDNLGPKAKRGRAKKSDRKK